MEFNEIVEHLDDLILLAYDEGFGLAATAMLGARARITGSAELFSQRVKPPAPLRQAKHDADPFD